MASRMGASAEGVTGSHTGDLPDVLSALTGGSVDLMLLSPERRNNKESQTDFRPLLAKRPSLLVIDYVHRILDWGHDFRPDSGARSMLSRISLPAIRLNPWKAEPHQGSW
jgi:ATP-dependent DNA helicase RecQ